MRGLRLTGGAAVAVMPLLVGTHELVAQEVRWVQRNSVIGRHSHAMAYDAARGQTVVFGGLRAPDPSVTPLDDTLLWNGTAWSGTPVSAGDPTARYGHAMAYDSVRRVTVVQGGFPGTIYPDDTWEWNGTVWQRREVAGPLLGTDDAMVYDCGRGVAVLVGRREEGEPPYGPLETWEWDGASWVQRQVVGPSSRSFFAMAYDSRRGVAVLFGGTGWPEATETWEWDGQAWVPRQVSGPPGRYGHAMAFDSARGVTVLFGGWLSSVLGDTWEWDGAAWSQAPIAGPPARLSHAMAYDSARQAIIMFGGTPHIANLSALGDTWELQLACYPDCDGDTAGPTLSIADFSCFLQKYAAGNPYANCDGSTAAPVLNVADFSCFLTRYAAGCS